MAYLARLMDDKASEIFSAKKAAALSGLDQEGDLMSVLMRANMDASPEDRLPDDELIGQMSTLAFAGTDTTTSAMTRVIDLLSRHLDVQEKLRTEIVSAQNGGDLTYDALMALPYLDAVCRETLRLYPPATFVYREAMKDAVLPLSKPIHSLDGSVLDKLIVPKGTTLILGIRSCNLNRDIWGPDAKEWKPERWSRPLPETVRNAKVPGVYSHMMTFLGGGRACIGFKFSQLEMKVFLSVLLSSFRFTRSRHIHWKISTFNYPTAGPDSTMPEMPVQVESL